jgi:hypothetical protein
MRKTNEHWTRYAWFFGGFLIGLTLISLGHASRPTVKRSVPVGPLNEIRSGKLTAPEMDAEFTKLRSLESRYAESDAQQKRLQASTARTARKLKPARRF